MKKWNLNVFTQNDQEYTFEDIYHLKEKMKQFNVGKLANVDTSSNTVLLPCVKWPILFSSKEVEKWIENAEELFGKPKRILLVSDFKSKL